MHQEICIPIAINIHQGSLHRRSLIAILPKTGCVRINRARVEVGIRENGHKDGPSTARIDTVRKVSGLDIDEYPGDASSLQFCCGEGSLGVLAT